MTEDDERFQALVDAVLALAETHSITAEEMVGLGINLVAAFLPAEVPDAERRRDVAHTLLDEALDDLEDIVANEPDSGAIN